MIKCISPASAGYAHSSPGARKVYVLPPGGNDIVFFRKVIGCPDHSRMSPFISGELFGLRVEKNINT